MPGFVIPLLILGAIVELVGIFKFDGEMMLNGFLIWAIDLLLCIPFVV